jgi:hypothetical protein
MKIVTAMTIAVLCLTEIVASPAGAAPHAAAAPPVPMTQTFTGGGVGRLTGIPHFPEEYGLYSSSGQIGDGSFGISDGPPPYPADALFTRSDGAEFHGVLGVADCQVLGPPGTACFSLHPVKGGSDIASAVVTLAETFSPESNGVQFLMRGELTLTSRHGYAMVGAHGQVYAFGGLSRFGDTPTSTATAIVATPSGTGYWVVDAGGHVFAFGDAHFFGNAGALLPGETVSSMSATPTAAGYWLFTSKGRALPFGDAHFFGDLRAITLTGPVVGSVATPTGKGYYMLGSDGGVFAFGDAKFRGSMGATHLNGPIVAMVPTANNAGYWLVGSDGGVFSFDAPFRGSLGALQLAQPIVSVTRYGKAYLMVAADGGVFNFSKVPFFGSAAGTPLPAGIVSATATG